MKPANTPWDFAFRFEALYRAGKTFAEIAKELDISESKAQEIGQTYAKHGIHRNTLHNLRKKEDPERPLEKESQVKTLQALDMFTRKNGFPPTMQELADDLRVSKAAIYNRLRSLEARGAITRPPNQAARMTLLTPLGRKLAYPQ